MREWRPAPIPVRAFSSLSRPSYLSCTFRVHRFREAEVEHFHHAVRADFDVGGFQIPMDDPLLVRGFECVRDLFRDWQGVG